MTKDVLDGLTSDDLNSGDYAEYVRSLRRRALSGLCQELVYLTGPDGTKVNEFCQCPGLPYRRPNLGYGVFCEAHVPPSGALGTTEQMEAEFTVDEVHDY